MRPSLDVIKKTIFPRRHKKTTFPRRGWHGHFGSILDLFACASGLHKI